MPHLHTTIWRLFKGSTTQREIERTTGISHPPFADTSSALL
jgi:hypothetical protein